MTTMRVIWLATAVAVVIGSTGSAFAAGPARERQKANDSVPNTTCVGCHASREASLKGGPHSGFELSCVECHSKIGKHMSDPLNIKPTSDLAGQGCTSCHENRRPKELMGELLDLGWVH